MARTAKKKELSPEEKLAAALVPENEQPYKVPENWCWVYLGNVTTIIMGQSPKGTSTTDDDSYMPLIGGASDMGTLYPKASRYTTMPTKVSHVDDIIICIRATLGKPIFSDGEYCLGRGVTAIRSDTLSKEFLRFCFMNFEQYFYDNAAGTTFAQVTSSTLSKMPIPLPPLPEQQRIVDLIESLFADLDEAKEKLTTIIDGFAQRKAAILHRAFTGELTERWREENGLDISQWKNRKLKDCGEWMGGGTPSISQSKYWENGDIPWVTSKDMKADTIEDTQMHTNMLGVENSSANYCTKPSLLFVTRSGILRRTLPISMIKIPFTVNQDLKVISPDKIHLDYLFWACKSSEPSILRTCMKNGTTVESINTSALKNYEIPIAPLNEQKEIVRILDEIFAKEQQAQSVVESVLADIELLKKSILARAFRGELGTGNPEDERAEELLKRVL